MLQSAIRGFAVDSLIREGRTPAFGRAFVQPLKNVYPGPPELEATFEVLSASSPNGRYKLIFDWYQAIDEDEGNVTIGGEPDSAPLLLDLRLAFSNQFESCGTDCAYHWGCWIDSTRFALAGLELVNSQGDFRGFMGIYSLAESTEVRYVTRLIPKDGYGGYNAAWHEWVSGRYWTWKNSRSKPSAAPRGTIHG